MDYAKKIFCPANGYTKQTVYVVEVLDKNGKVKGYLSNGCDDMFGGEVCEKCRADVAAQFAADFRA